MKQRSEVFSLRLQEDDIKRITAIGRAMHNTRTFVGKSDVLKFALEVTEYALKAQEASNGQ